MVTYAQLRTMDTSKLTGAAEAAGSLAGVMTTRGGEVASVAQIPAGMWAGLDASAASGMMSPLSGPLYDVSDSATNAQGVIDTLVTELEKAKTKLDDAHDLIAGTGITIGADGTVTTPVVDDKAVADRNARIAEQVVGIIDAAVEMANKADDTAVGALASAGGALGKLFGFPQNSPLGPWALGPWGAGQGISQFGTLASYMGNVRLGRFMPRGPNGRFISPSSLSKWGLFKAGAGPGFNKPSTAFGALPYQSASRAKWLSTASKLGNYGAVLGGVTSGAEQLVKDWNNPNMGVAEKGTRAVYAGGVQGGAAWAGGVAGAQIGAGIGTMIAPGVGTVVGGAIGGIVGGFAGSEAGKWVVDNSIDAVGNAAESVADGLGSAADAAGDVIDDITPW